MDARTLWSTTLAVALLSLTSTAHAMDEVEKVPLEIHGDREGTNYHLYRNVGDDEILVAACLQDCTLALPQGAYHLRVAGDATPSTKLILLDRPTSVSVKSSSSTWHISGLVVGIMGTGLLASGLISTLFVGGKCDGCTPDQEHDRKVKRQHDLEIFSAIGGVVAIAGWTTFFLTGTSIDVRDRPSVALQVLPTIGGASFGAIARF